MTIFFFTLTTYVAHGDVNINVMLMSMLYNMICDPSEPHNKKEQVDINHNFIILPMKGGPGSWLN